jgi:hypothetical protein
MRICRHISGISHTRTVPVDTHFLAIELVGRCLTVAGIAWEGFPEMAAFEEFEAGAREIGCLEYLVKELSVGGIAIKVVTAPPCLAMAAEK